MLQQGNTIFTAIHPLRDASLQPGESSFRVNSKREIASWRVRDRKRKRWKRSDIRRLITWEFYSTEGTVCNLCANAPVQSDKDECTRETVRNQNEHPSASRGSNVIVRRRRLSRCLNTTTHSSTRRSSAGARVATPCRRSSRPSRAASSRPHLCCWPWPITPGPFPVPYRPAAWKVIKGGKKNSG